MKLFYHILHSLWFIHSLLLWLVWWVVDWVCLTFGKTVHLHGPAGHFMSNNRFNHQHWRLSNHEYFYSLILSHDIILRWFFYKSNCRSRKVKRQGTNKFQGCEALFFKIGTDIEFLKIGSYIASFCLVLSSSKLKKNKYMIEFIKNQFENQRVKKLATNV